MAGTAATEERDAMASQTDPAGGVTATASKPGGISLHAVDVARGVPAQGMQVELWALAPVRRLVAQGRLGPNGQLDHPSVTGEGVTAGEHEALFHVGDYLRAHGGAHASPFLEVLPFRFQVRDVAQHVHLPLKFTAWGCALFRGS
jgi:5-hydroxyisourate hydrolase